jgi:xanthine dehydrogenase molybdopterin-binding subunit B
VERYTIAVDPGIVINPMQLKRQVEGGAVMRMGHSLLEEVMFDESGITTEDWLSYPIPTMSDIPEIKVVLINNPLTVEARKPRTHSLHQHRSSSPRRNRKDNSATTDETRLRSGYFENVTENLA